MRASKNAKSRNGQPPSRGGGTSLATAADPAGRTAAAVEGPPSGNLDQRLLLKTLTAFKRGDFTARMPDDYTGIAGKIADTLNEVIEHNQSMAA